VDFSVPLGCSSWSLSAFELSFSLYIYTRADITETVENFETSTLPHQNPWDAGTVWVGPMFSLVDPWGIMGPQMAVYSYRRDVI
jgi:hypothetical protein